MSVVRFDPRVIRDGPVVKSAMVDEDNGSYVDYKDYEQLEQRVKELQAQNERLKAKANAVLPDLAYLLEHQPQNMEDGSYDVDGQSGHELHVALNETPAQSLAAIQAEAIEKAIKYVEEKSLHGGLNTDALYHVQDYIEQLKTEDKQ
jgi:hypothetical protein